MPFSNLQTFRCLGTLCRHKFACEKLIFHTKLLRIFYLAMKSTPNVLYGVEVKFYNMEVELDEHLESCHKGLYIIGDGSGVTHSLSHASASGVYVARQIAKGE